MCYRGRVEIPMPADYLLVEVPQRPSGPRAPLPPRLARNVAAMFGVPVPDSPTGLTWAGDYNRVSVLDIARGAPTPGRGRTFAVDDGIPGGYGLAERTVQQLGGPAGQGREVTRAVRTTLDDIPPGSLNEYGPDTRAAVVVAASDLLFGSLADVFDETLQLLSVKESGVVADPGRLAIWAFLLSEVFRCQPALTAAAIQATGIQRASLAGIRPFLDPSLQAETTRNEYGAQGDLGAQQPHSVGLFETLRLPQLERELAERIGPGSEANADGEFGSRSGYPAVLATLTNRTTALMLNQSRTLVRQNAAGRRWVEGSANAGLWIPVLVAEALSAELKTSALSDPGAPRPWDFRDPDEFETIVPHLPSAVDLRRLRDPRSITATVLTALSMVNFLRTLKIRRPSDSPQRLATTRGLNQHLRETYLEPLTDTSAAVLGAHHPVTTLCETLVLRNRVYAAGTGGAAPSEQDATALSNRVLDVNQRMRTALEKDEITLHHFAEYIRRTSPELNGLRRTVTPEQADTLYRTLLEDWEASHSAWQDSPEAVHNYAGLLIAAPADLDMVRRGVSLAEGIFDRRREFDLQRGDKTMSRTRATLQVIQRGWTRLADATGDPHDIKQLEDVTERLMSHPGVKQLLESQVITDRAGVTLAANLLLAGDSLTRHGRESTLSDSAPQLAQMVLNYLAGDDSQVPRFATRERLEVVATAALSTARPAEPGQ